MSNTNCKYVDYMYMMILYTTLPNRVYQGIVLIEASKQSFCTCTMRVKMPSKIMFTRCKHEADKTILLEILTLE